MKKNIVMKKSNLKIGKIGIFDSGVGGLEILKEIVKKLPQYDYIYLGDTARTPYGSRSSQIIYDFTIQAIEFLFQKEAFLIILACNTASSEALFKLRKKWLPKNYPERKVLGVIVPICEKAVKTTKKMKVGVIATERTVVSGVFLRELKKLNSEIKVFQKSCPLLVPFIESGESNSEFLLLLLKKYLFPLLQKKIDTLILGCTHYGFLEKEIKKIVGKKIKVLSEGKVVAENLKNYLKQHSALEKNLTKHKSLKIFTTDLTKNFKILATRFFGKNIELKRIILEKNL